MASIDPTAELPGDAPTLATPMPAAPTPAKTWNFLNRKKARKMAKKANKKKYNTSRAYQDANPGV